MSPSTRLYRKPRRSLRSMSRAVRSTSGCASGAALPGANNHGDQKCLQSLHRRLGLRFRSGPAQSLRFSAPVGPGSRAISIVAPRWRASANSMSARCATSASHALRSKRRSVVSSFRRLPRLRQARAQPGDGPRQSGGGPMELTIATIPIWTAIRAWCKVMGLVEDSRY